MSTDNHSILWEDTVRQADEAVLAAIAAKIVSGGEAHQAKCVEKMMATIATEEWQRKYPHGNRNFVFCVYYAININLVEIEFGLSAQAIDALYFLMTKDGKEQNFSKKMRHVFKEVYGHAMPTITAEAVRVLRNNIMHTGAIFGIDDPSFSHNKEVLEKYCKKYQSTGQHMTDTQILVTLAGSFDYLVRDLVVRVLGLEWEDLHFNLSPPSRLIYFYDKPTNAQG